MASTTVSNKNCVMATNCVMTSNTVMRKFKITNKKTKCLPLMRHYKMLVANNGDVLGGNKRSVVTQIISADGTWTTSYAENQLPYENNRPALLSANPPSWADPLDPNTIDFTKRPGCKFLKRSASGKPINPMGKTGSVGRGQLGNWAGNRAGDSIISTFKKKDGQLELTNGLPTLLFIGVCRGDKGRGDSEFALPGGMIKTTQLPDGTLVYENYLHGITRELFEEAYDVKEEEGKKEKEYVENLIKREGYVLFGCIDNNDKQTELDDYIDDVRNTDEAWMEGVAVAWHDHQGHVFEKLTKKLKAGDDAAKSLVLSYHPNDKTFKLFASHGNLVIHHYNNLVEIV